MDNINIPPEKVVAQTQSIDKSVTLGLETIDILRDVSLTIHGGTSASISGISGSGKTTLLGILAGLDLPSSGTVSLLGRKLNEMNEDQRAQLRCGKVGFVFQSFHLLPNLTALENVSLALEVVPGSEQIVERSLTALEHVGLAARAHHLPSQMSGGEQQRVALARAIVTEPAILFADEPTGNLDHATSGQVEEMMFSLCKDFNSALVVVTHNMALAERCDRHHVIEAGRLL
jgi:putative ABC transport system ATP-binding protein